MSESEFFKNKCLGFRGVIRFFGREILFEEALKNI
jgi:hypothetical protein